MTRIDRSPTAVSGSAAVAIGLLALAPGVYDLTALLAGVVGFVALAVGVTRGVTGAVTIGATALLLASVLAGIDGAPVEALLVGVTATVIAWDAGGTAITLGDQLGSDADTVRLEAVRLGASALVGTVTAVGGYAVYRTAGGGVPSLALLCLLVAAALLASALR
ncbi:hypothetical protein [Halosimplex sp. TS25]|uniref:DUF7519 family protein n=1 Tax=Halosimplex rarum TaxID=3396619 RepID=UPI0039EC14BC